MSPEQLARAIAAFADEHGAPNGVTAGELADFMGKSRLSVGKLLTFERDSVNRALASRGYVVTDYSRWTHGMRIEIEPL